jgi:HK97 family phage major capsid protein
MPEVQSETYKAPEVVKQTIEALGAKLVGVIDELKTSEGAARDALGKEMERIKTQVEGLNSALKNHESRPNFSGIEVGKNGEPGKVSFGRIVQLVTNPKLIDRKEYGLEADIYRRSQEYADRSDTPPEVKALIGSATDPSGGFLIPTEIQEQIWPELLAGTIAGQLGVTQMNDLMGNVEFIRETAGPTAVYVDSEADPAVEGAESGSTFAAISLVPHTLGAFVPLSRNMLIQKPSVIESYVRAELVRRTQIREDLTFFLGTGNNSEPRGVLLDPQVQNYTWTSTAATDWRGTNTNPQKVSGDLIAMADKVSAKNGIGPASKLGWAMGTKTQSALANAMQEGIPLFRGMNELFPNRLLGIPALASTQLNSAANTTQRLLFGDWSKAYIGRWGGMALAASDEAGPNFRTGRRTIRLLLSHDVCLIYGDVVVSASGAGVAQTGNVDITNSGINV